MKEKQRPAFSFDFDIRILQTARMSVHSGPVIISAATGSQQYRHPLS